MRLEQLLVHTTEVFVELGGVVDAAAGFNAGVDAEGVEVDGWVDGDG